jgi:hypothetical protein
MTATLPDGSTCAASSHGQCVHFLGTRDSVDYRTTRDDSERNLPRYQPDRICPKCREASPVPRYIAGRDVLVVTCGTCGWQYEAVPGDDAPCNATVIRNAVTVSHCWLRAGHKIAHDFD